MNSGPFSLEGKKILVTGASSGIGKAIAIECAKAGSNLIINGRDKTRLMETYNLLDGDNHSIVSADISIPGELSELLEKIDHIDGLVHSVGINKRLPLKFISDASIEEIMKVNFMAPAMLTQKLVKKKALKNNSSVVFISSIASCFASLGNISYMASKGAMNSFMKGTALELAPSGIRVNAIQPGMIKTHLTTINDEQIEKDMKNYPLGRYGYPEEVAYAAVYLLSDAASWMTGSILTIDGGLTLK